MFRSFSFSLSFRTFYNLSVQKALRFWKKNIQRCLSFLFDVLFLIGTSTPVLYQHFYNLQTCLVYGTGFNLVCPQILVRFFYGATAQVGPRPPASLLRFLEPKKLDTDRAGLLWTSYQLFADAATYATITRERIFMPSPEFELATPKVKWQHRTGIGCVVYWFFIFNFTVHI
jgi:hypothetical protein